MADARPNSGGSKRDWLENTIELIESSSAGERDEGLVAAVGIWVGYPLIAMAIECHPSATQDEKGTSRNYLDAAHHQATHRLMLEAELAGLNPAPLAEERRVCQELFQPVRGQGSQATPASPYGVDWFNHPRCINDTWPDCLGGWRYALPPAMQEAILEGEEIFGRLMTRLSLRADALGAGRSDQLEVKPGSGGRATVTLNGIRYDVTAEQAAVMKAVFSHRPAQITNKQIVGSDPLLEHQNPSKVRRDIINKMPDELKAKIKSQAGKGSVWLEGLSDPDFVL